MSERVPREEKSPLVYLITDGETTAENFPEKSRALLELVATAVNSKVDLIQIREKKLSARLVFELASRAALVTRGTPTKLLINDRADVALAARADGVHLTSASLPARHVRRVFPPGFVVGVSAHSLPEAESAAAEGADFVTFSPVFETPSKAKYGLAPQGLENLKAVCGKLENFPVIALGGIHNGNFVQVLGSGAAGFAAIRFLNDAENLRKLCADLGKG